MRQVFLEKGIVKVKEVCEPILSENTVLIEVFYSCISPGTEGSTIANAQKSLFSTIPLKLPKVMMSIAKNGIEGTKALIKEKLAGDLQTLGYSCSGKVIAVGKKITKFRAGDFVACAGAGFAHHAEMIAVPENLVVKVTNQDYLKEASITTLGAIALQGLRRANLMLGETVCVLGLGLLGQLTVQLAKLSGCKVIGIDLIPERLELAKKIGADSVLNPREHALKDEIDFITAHNGVDSTIITAGSSNNTIIQQSMEITRKKGRVVLVGDVPLTCDRSPFYQKEIDFLISCSYGPGRYDGSYEQNGLDYPFAYVRWTENRNMQSIVDFIEQKRLDVNSLISESASIEQAEQAYERLKNQSALAVILSYREEKEAASYINKQEQKIIQQKSQPTFIPAYKDNVRVGVIGAGGFAKVKLMPIISRIKNVKINAIVDANIANSITVSKTYGAAKALSDDSKLFDEDLVDAVLIASPHKYHCNQALAALENGKAVFLEKPMVTDFDQLKQFQEFFQKNSNIPFCVDYNRSFAPFMQKIKKEIEKRTSPLVVQYRMNAGFIPKDHWIQTEVGAGRIIGEACHIFDLFMFLTDSEPVAVSVEAIKPKNDDLFPTDNFSAQFSFQDGSICTLLYTSLGHKDLSKERMELFYDSKAILMDDFKILQGFGLPSSFNEKVMVPDKGHEHLLHEFFNRIRMPDYQPAISLRRLSKVAEITLIIDQLACQGGGSQEINP
jgi:predicted dehydrogenase/threonine dehydrogenase-like Zn-dependent dehydrogenase